MRTHLFLAIALLVTPSLLNAQSMSATGSTNASVNSQATASSGAQLNVAVTHATQAGVPQSVVENKIAEGRAKGASDAQIASAIENRIDLLAQATSVLQAQGSAVTAASVNAVASVLEAGGSLTSSVSGQGALNATLPAITAGLSSSLQGVLGVK